LTTIGLLIFGAAAGAEVDPMTDLSIGDGTQWAFLGGQWTQSDRVIRPADQRDLHSRAFHIAEAYSDTTVEFEYNPSYRETGSGFAGLILRAADANHFYLVYFPWNAMNLRAKHFWAAVAKVDGDGYLRNIKLAWVPGVPSETERWFQVRVEAVGPHITVKVNGRAAVSVTDETFQSGYVGLAGYGWYAFRNVRVAGTTIAAPAWDRSAQIPEHWFEVGLGSAGTPSGCVAPNGDVLLISSGVMVRSRDKGRNWEPPTKLPDHLTDIDGGWDTIVRPHTDKLIMMCYRRRDRTQALLPQILMTESTDSGHTWSPPIAAQVEDGWPQHPARLHPYGDMFETGDGTLLRLIYGEVGEFREWGEAGTLTDIRTWSAVHCKAYAIRSLDEGKSWSAPIEMDRPAWANAKRGSIPGSMDFTESTGVAIGNKVMALIRPVYSPTMWQCWSNDAGATWDAAVRVTFPGYAQSILRTGSGVIACAHRFPLYSINASLDDGLNWDEGTVIDYPVWAMGAMFEVEPDVMLVTYRAAMRDQPLRAQLIEIKRSDPRTLPGSSAAKGIKLVPLRR
jgi:hypothetical protein